MGQDPFDDLARALAKPMPRRTAMRMLAVGLGAAAVPGLIPRRARAAAPSAPCSSGGKFCGYPDHGGYNIGCCMGAGGDTRTVCCPGQSGVYGSCCCPTGYACTFPGSMDPDCCKCKSGVTCGDACCKSGEYCETYFGFDSVCTKLCPDGSHKCNGNCCTGLEDCGFFGCSCKSGFVSCGTGQCCSPKKDPGDPNPGFNPVRNMLNMMGASSASHGGSGRRGVFAHTAQTGLAGVDAALDALAAVNGQGAAAMLAIRGSKHDPAFSHKVTVTRVKPPTVAAGPGLDAASAAALNKLLVAEARANALIAATAKALWRARAAQAKHNHGAAKTQFRASATFASQAVTALKRIQALRTAAAKALTAGKVAEALAFDDAVTAFLANVKSSGIPATLTTPMAQLGVASADLKRLSAGVLDQTVSAASGPALIAPLQNQARAKELKSLISVLSKYSKRARKYPLAH